MRQTSPLLALLLIAAPTFAMTPDQLQPLDKWAYDQYVKQNPSKTEAYLDEHEARDRRRID